MKTATEMKEITVARIAKNEALHKQNITNFCEKFANRIEQTADNGQSCYLIDRKAIPLGITAEEVCKYYREFGYEATIERYTVNIRW